MKNSIILLVLVTTVLFSACQEEYIEPNEFSDVGWYTSQFRETELFKIGVNDYISFANLSQNEVEHFWAIDRSSFFLEGPIGRTDSVFSKYIVNPGDTMSVEKTVHVLFTQGGLQQVRLYNTFRDSVAFRGQDTLSAQKVGDLWVIDTTFVVDVYDTIVTNVLVRQEGVDLALGTDTIYVEAGATLEFVDLTTVGRPDTRSWRVAGESSSDSTAQLTFKKLGVFEAVFTSSRAEPNIPTDFERFILPNPIKVIPSSKPFELAARITETEDETLLVPFNGELNPFANQTTNFTVTINGQPASISSVTLSTNDATIVEIKMAEPIYRPDTIVVSYVGGTLESTDTRLAQAFSDEQVIMHDVNLLPTSYGFEPEGEGWEPMWDNGADFEYTTEKAASGQYSLKITKLEGQAAGKFHSIGIPFNMEAEKTYTLKYKIWVDPANTANSINTWILPNWKQFWQPLSDLPKGEWVTITQEHTAPAAEDERRFMIQIPENGTFYFDDFYMVEKEERP
ncbi:MAG: hypothetical protein AAF632_03770 [Bacteroidota bacterium]